MEKHNVVALDLNMKSEGNFETIYDLSEGSKEFVVPIPKRCSVGVEIIVGVFQYPKGVDIGVDLTGVLNGVIKIKHGTDGVNSVEPIGAETFTMNEAQEIGGWKEAVFASGFCHIDLDVVGVTGGTLRIMLTTKPIQ